MWTCIAWSDEFLLYGVLCSVLAKILRELVSPQGFLWEVPTQIHKGGFTSKVLG